jgi:hypothetical protein
MEAKSSTRIDVVFPGGFLDEIGCLTGITWHSPTVCVEVAQGSKRTRTSRLGGKAKPMRRFLVIPFYSDSMKIERSEIEFSSSET